MEKSMHNLILRDKFVVWPFGCSHSSQFAHFKERASEKKNWRRQALRPSRIWLMHDTQTNLRIEIQPRNKKSAHTHTIWNRENFLFSRHCNSSLKRFCFGQTANGSVKLVTILTNAQCSVRAQIDKRFIWSIFYSN